MKLTLTASSMACALRCPRRYYYDNVLGLKEANPPETLRIGTAVHNGDERRARGDDFAAQYNAALTGGTLDEWMAAKVFGILGAYDRTYGEIEDRDYAAMNPEVEFADAIGGSRTFEQRGKVDGLAVLRDGRRVVWERKTTSDDLSDTSGYWERLRFNIQLLAYAGWVCNATGELPVCVYDVVRKPQLQPKANVPELDANGLPIVLDANGQRCIKRDGAPKKTADAAKGEKVAGHPETPDEYGSRILETMCAESERYIARREVAVTEDMLDEFRRERLGVCRMLLHFAAAAWNDFMAFLSSGAAKGYDNVVIDSFTRAQEFATQNCIESIPGDSATIRRSVEQWQYGKGAQIVYDKFAQVYPAIDALLECGANVCAICHDNPMRTSNPDGGDYVQHQPHLVQGEKGKATGGVTRTLYTGGIASMMAKSRTAQGMAINVPAGEVFDWSQIIH